MNLFFVLVISFSFAFAGEKVGNGEGLGEQRVTSTNEYLAFYLNFCMKGGCMMGRAELDVANTLLNVRRSNPKLTFISAKKAPGVFNGAGLGAWVNTGKDPSGPVRVNLDRLYSNSSVISSEEALGLVVDIYSFKAAAEASASFKQKLSIALAKNVTTTQHSFDHSYLKVTLYKSANDLQRSLFVNDGDVSVNINRPLAEFFHCRGSQNVVIKKVAWSSSHPVAIYVSGTNPCHGSAASFDVLVELKATAVGGQIPGWLTKYKLIEENSIQAISIL